MKSELVVQPKAETELTYPCLRTDVRDRFTVLFTDATTGTVVNISPGAPWGLGGFSDKWFRASCSATWKPATQAVLLTP